MKNTETQPRHSQQQMVSLWKFIGMMWLVAFMGLNAMWATVNEGVHSYIGWSLLTAATFAFTIQQINKANAAHKPSGDNQR